MTNPKQPQEELIAPEMDKDVASQVKISSLPQNGEARKKKIIITSAQVSLSFVFTWCLPAKRV